MEQKLDAVAHNLKELRENRGLSLDQLSGKTGVSKSMLRQIENGKSNPTIATIWKISNGLKISFTTLLQQPQVEAQVKPFKGQTVLKEEEGRYRVYPLVPFDPERAFETFYIEMEPNTSFHGEPHEGNVYEYLYIISGTLMVTINGEEFTAGKNEMLQFYANCPHDYANVGNDTVTAITQISYLA